MMNEMASGVVARCLPPKGGEAGCGAAAAHYKNGVDENKSEERYRRVGVEGRAARHMEGRAGTEGREWFPVTHGILRRGRAPSATDYERDSEMTRRWVEVRERLVCGRGGWRPVSCTGRSTCLLRVMDEYFQST